MSDDGPKAADPGLPSENLYVVVDCSSELINLLSVNSVQPESGIVADIDIGELLYPRSSESYYTLKSQPITESPPPTSQPKTDLKLDAGTRATHTSLSPARQPPRTHASDVRPHPVWGHLACRGRCSSRTEVKPSPSRLSSGMRSDHNPARRASFFYRLCTTFVFVSESRRQALWPELSTLTTLP